MTMNEALQQSLYDKLSREQDKYRDWLKGQPHICQLKKFAKK